MPNAASSSRSTEPPARARPAARCRASKACRRCNEKRVKCDASEKGMPCSRCRARNEPECRLIQSRRGIYVRKPRQPRAAAAGPVPPTATAAVRDRPDEAVRQPSGERTWETTPASSESRLQPRGHSPHPCGDPDAGQHRPARDGAGRPMDDSTRSTPASGAGEEHDTPDSGARGEHDTPSPHTDASAQSLAYREISWAGMIGPLFEGAARGEDVVDKCSITYLGESFPLAMVLKDLSGTARPRLHHPGPPCPPCHSSDVHVATATATATATTTATTTAAASAPPRQHPPYMGAEELAFLEAKRAFEAPARATRDALVGVFLERVFPLYPIVHRDELLQQHRARRLPWILLHAVCFLAVTFGPARVLHRAGFATRREARWCFYRKAKALFDVGYEGNKLVLLQVAIMMSFWGGGPNHDWNFYAWISTAVTLAEGLGCHRSLAATNMRPPDRSLLRRLWWVLVVRDTTCAALVGRPFRVNLDQSDAEPLTVDDFVHDGFVHDDFVHDDLVHDGAGPSPGPAAGSRFDLYQIEATKLILILRDMIMARFHPMRGPTMTTTTTTTTTHPQQTAEGLAHALQAWRAQLPPELEWSQDAARYTNVFASTLCILYHHHRILTHLPCPADPLQTAPHRPPPLDEVARAAAQQIAAAACVVTTRSDLLRAPHELFHGIFMAAVVFYRQTKSPQPMVAQLGLSGLSNCQMLFHASRDFWDPSPWITQLFDKVLCATAAQESTRGPASTASASVTGHGSGPPDHAPSNVVDDSSGGDGGGHTTLFLHNVYTNTMHLSYPGHPDHPDHPDQPGPDVAAFVDDTPVATTTGTAALDESAVCAAGYDLWQSHLVLGNLFDGPSGALLPAPSALDDRPVSWFDT